MEDKSEEITLEEEDKSLHLKVRFRVANMIIGHNSWPHFKILFFLGPNDVHG